MHLVVDLRQRGKARRSARVLAAGRRILAEEGPEALQMRAVAEEAEISVRTLYNLFGSKAEIVSALVAEAVAGLERELEALAVADPIDRSRAIITVSIARFARDGAYHRRLLAFANSHGGSGELAYRRARALQEEALGAAMRQRLLAQTVPSEPLAHQVLSAWSYGSRLWAAGTLDATGFETHVLHAWACMLLGLARGETRARFVAELEALAAPMQAIIADAAAESRSA